MIYTLDDKYYCKTDLPYTTAIEPTYGDTMKCPVCGAPLTMRCWLPPWKVSITGSRYPDYIPFFAGHGLVITQRVKDIYTENALTGISSFNPLEVVNAEPSCPQYYDAIVDFQEADINYRKSKFKSHRTKHRCALCNPKGIFWQSIKGLVFQKGFEPKSDVFHIYGYGHGVFFSEKFVQVFEKEIPDFKFVCTENHEF